MALKHGHFGKFIRNTWKFLEFGGGNGWKRSVRPIFWRMKKCYTKTRKTWTSYIKRKRGKLNF